MQGIRRAALYFCTCGKCSASGTLSKVYEFVHWAETLLFSISKYYIFKVHIDCTGSDILFLLIWQALEIWGDSAGSKSRHLVIENKNKGPGLNLAGIWKGFLTHSKLACMYSAFLAADIHSARVWWLQKQTKNMVNCVYYKSYVKFHKMLTCRQQYQ